MPLPPPETMEINYRRNGGPGYGHGDTYRLNPLRLGTPLAETVQMVIDERSAHMADLLSGVDNLDLRRGRLAVGDILATHGENSLVITLTTPAEMGAAMEDGRLAMLVHRLGDEGHAACIMVEGGLYQTRTQPLPRLSALHARLTFGVRVPVIETIDRRHTVYMVVCCVRDWFFPDIARARFDPHPPAMPASGPADIARYMLEAVPGVSGGRAAALLARFGTIEALTRGTRHEIATTDGVGKVTAARIMAVLGSSDAAGNAAATPNRAGWSPLERF